jgi:hypothetical protein
MSADARPPGADDADRDALDWSSPRWREADAPTDGEERGRRFRNDAAPRQRGAIDAEDSVGSKDEGATEPPASG